MTTESTGAKTPMTDEERAALCQKLDHELDEFINSLESKRYTEGWPEDRWEVSFDPTYLGLYRLISYNLILFYRLMD